MNTQNEGSFAGVNATGEIARTVRREINKNTRYQKGPTYLHEWHECLNELPGKVSVFCVGMDVGGFPKNLLQSFQRRGIEFTGYVVGVDFEPSRIRKLKNQFRDTTGFCFCTDDPETIRFADASSDLGCGKLHDRSFDVAICTYALHDKDVLKPERAIQGLARVLKSDGFCMVATHARSSFPEILEMYRQACRDLGLNRQAKAEFTHFDNFAQEDAGTLLNKYFEEVNFHAVDTSLIFEVDGVQDSMRDFMAYCDYFPFPLLASKEVSDEKLQMLRKRFEEIARSNLHTYGQLKISKPSGVFLCRHPHC